MVSSGFYWKENPEESSVGADIQKLVNVEGHMFSYSQTQAMEKLIFYF